MLAAERRQVILELLAADRFASSELLAGRLGVSLETIRRDLSSLETQGKLVRVRGGASQVGASPVEEPTYVERVHLAPEAKASIGSIAAGMLTPGSTVMIDVGTTCVEVAKAIPKDFRGRVVTCNLLAAIELADRPHVEVHVSGGQLRPGDMTLSNSYAVDFFANLRPDIAFLGSGGIDMDAGLTDYYFDEAATRKIVLGTAARSFVLADHTKHDRIAPFRVCGLESIDGLITDRLDSPALKEGLERAGIPVYAAKQDELTTTSEGDL